jgi:ribosomal-protein-alanine N-acetyltransferase
MTAQPKLDPKLISLLWAGPERAGEIAEMHARLFQPPWDPAGIAKLLEHPASTAFVAQIGVAPKVTVGFIMGQVMADEAEILTIGVAPELQQRGVGRLLVEGFRRAAKRAEAKRMFLEVAADNASAIALYQGFNFAETRRRKAYYPREGAAAVDAIVLQADL